MLDLEPGTDTSSAVAKAIAAMASLPPFEPVASVGYQSQGRLCIVADDDALLASSLDALADKLSVAVLWCGSAEALSVAGRGIECQRATEAIISGYLGAFAVQWQGGAGAAGTAQSAAAFDLILDLRSTSAFAMHQLPQGYYHATSVADLGTALQELPELIGEFEKPKFFAYKESICAHSRSRKSGCNKCIDICSTKAIASAGDIVSIDPHLCMGCGACATVCPSGAMSYQYPRVADRGAQLRAALGAYRAANTGDAPVVLFHAETREVADLPPNVLPIGAWHPASVGLDVMLGAISYGAAGVVVLHDAAAAPQYSDATRKEMQTGELILNALGFAGVHFTSAVDTAAIDWARFGRAAIASPAAFHLSNDKRATLEFSIEHLAKQAAQRIENIPLPAGAMWGALKIDTEKCTMCLACAGACPESALMDGGDASETLAQLNFLERNCVQCGLCASTCPEDAISLVPRLLLTDQRKQKVVLNEAKPFDCISCGKALGTQQMIRNMLAKLSGHSMFAADGALNRLKMCADCRVVDMMSNPHEVSVLTGKPMP